MSEPVGLQPLSPSQRELLEEATTSYQASLSGAAEEWLEGRGLGFMDRRSARLGVVTDPFPGHEKFRGFLAIPYLGRDDQPLTIRFRCLQDHDHREHFHGKYMSVAEDIPRAYNVRALHRAGDELEVTEGELDAILLESLGLNAIAIPGAQLWKPHHPRLLAGFNKVRVWADPDDAGAALTAKITHSVRQAKGVRLRDGDVTETYLAHGAAELLRLAS